MQPAEVIGSGSSPPTAASPQQLDEEADLLEQGEEEFLLLQSAISKTYRAKLLEFRRTMTPDVLESVRASLPPEHQPDLDLILQEVAALDSEEEDEEGAHDDEGIDGLSLTAAEAAALEVLEDPMLPTHFLRWACFRRGSARRRFVHCLLPSQRGGYRWQRSPINRGNPISSAMPWMPACLRSGLPCPPTSLPTSHLTFSPSHPPSTLHHRRSYLSDMFPEGTSEDRMEEMLDQLPVTVLDELKALFAELKEFEAAEDSDMDAVAQRVRPGGGGGRLVVKSRRRSTARVL